MEDRIYCIYMMTDLSNSVLYIGVTNNLPRRVQEHKAREVEGFTKKYHAVKLIYYECGSDVAGAIFREKQLKRWSRAKKEYLIKQMNPSWKDLSDQLV